MAAAGPIRVGDHAIVQLRPAEQGAGTDAEVCVTVDVPFALRSMADAQLDISATTLKLRGPKPENAEVVVPLPEGLQLNPDEAAARYSKRSRQLVVVSPFRGSTRSDSAQASAHFQPPQRSTVLGAAPEPPSQAAADPSGSRLACASVLSEAATSGSGGCASGDADDDDDDDDLPPPLEAARSKLEPNSGVEVDSPVAQQICRSSDPDASPAGAEFAETNEAAEALMQRALQAREKKQKESDEARKNADLASGGGLKKGFFSKAKGKSKSVAAESTKQEEIPYISGAGSFDEARKKSLELPEVQKAMLRQNAEKLSKDQSWVTPELVNAFRHRPDLIERMSKPNIQAAMTLMQTDPEAAKEKYKNDKEVTAFIKDFSSMMGTHFDVLGKKEAAAAPQPVPIADDEVAKILMDPEVQGLVRELQAGRPLELHELGQTNPHLLRKVKVLLDKGLLKMGT